ncbi:hypothetical protein Tco_0381413 [Tanacetum coccineum]
MPPPPTPFGSNTIPSHVTPGLNINAGSNTIPSHATSASTGPNKGKCPLIPKKRGRPAKSSASSSRGGSRGGATNKGGSRGDATSKGDFRGGSRGGASKRGRGSSKRGRCSNTMPLQCLRDESSNEEHQFNMDMKAVYGMEREQVAIDEDDQFWEDCVRQFDKVEEHMAQDKGMSEGVFVGKQPMAQDKGMSKDVSARKQPMIEDDLLEVGLDLPTQESTIEANPKPTKSKKSKAAEDPNHMRIFHKNRWRSERIFNQKMKNFKFDEHGSGSTPDKTFDV